MILTPLADAALAAEESRHAEVEALQAQITQDTLDEAALAQSVAAAQAALNAANVQIAALQAQLAGEIDQDTADQATIAALNAQIASLQVDPWPLPSLDLPVRPVMGTDLNYALFGASAFIDDFDGPTIDRAKWITRLPWGGLTNNTESAGGRSDSPDHQIQYFGDKQDPLVTPSLPDPFSFGPSVLRITSRPTGDWNATRGMSYLSGLLSTFSSFGQTYGMMEICCRMPNRKGAWPAFWMGQKSPLAWPPEIDVFEYLVSRGRTKYNSGFIRGLSTNPSQGFGNGADVETGVDLSAAYHVYTMVRTADQVLMYFDGVEKRRLDVPAGYLLNPFYMIVSLGIGGVGAWGNQGGPPDAGAIDCLDVDYVLARPWLGTPPSTQTILTITAHSATAGGQLVVQVDGGTPFAAKTLTTAATAYSYSTTPGWHTVKMWQADPSKVITLDSISHNDGTTFPATTLINGTSKTFTKP